MEVKHVILSEVKMTEEKKGSGVSVSIMPG